MDERVIETRQNLGGLVEPTLTFLCHHCAGININLAGTKFCAQCGKQVFIYTDKGRERV